MRCLGNSWWNASWGTQSCQWKQWVIENILGVRHCEIAEPLAFKKFISSWLLRYRKKINTTKLYKICPKWLLETIGVPEVQSSYRDPNGFYNNPKSEHVWEATNKKCLLGLRELLLSARRSTWERYCLPRRAAITIECPWLAPNKRPPNVSYCFIISYNPVR